MQRHEQILRSIYAKHAYWQQSPTQLEGVLRLVALLDHMAEMKLLWGDLGEGGNGPPVGFLAEM